MALNKQVSLVIRISREKRDVSARATHLEAATRKFLAATNERKQMSKKTTFKRIALVAVASLGFGVLSAAPSNSAVNADSLTIKNTAGVTTSAIAVANGETITAYTSATATLTFLPGTAADDSITVTAALVSAPAGNTALPYMALKETTSAKVYTGANAGSQEFFGNGSQTTSGGTDNIAPNVAATCQGQANATVSTCVFDLYLGKGSATAGPTVAGTYVVTVKAANRDGTTSNAGTATVTFTVASASVGTTSGTAYMTGTVTGNVTMASADLTPVIVTKTISTSPKALIKVTQVTPSTANESVTATISAGPGTLGSGTNTALATGRSILVKNGDTITVWADGSDGVTTITLTGSTSGYAFSTKTVTFTGSAIAKLVLAVESPVINASGGSADDAISVTAFDAAGKQISAPTFYVTSADLSKISQNGSACTGSGWYAAYAASYCNLTAVSAGTAKITVSTHALASVYQGDGVTTTKVTSNEVSVRVGSVTAAKFSLTLDKASYAPGEKATLTVTPLDAAGLPVAGTSLDGYATYANFFTTGGITSDYATYSGSDTTTATFLAPSTVTGVKKFTVYMPLQSSTVTFKASAGTHFGAAYQTSTGATTGTPVSVAVKVVANTEAAQALAAVTALAVTVASLKTLITTLTNLVLKIQKKVKA
jgi:hypothetical protein